MIFPWAECDLETFWDKSPSPDLTDIGLIRWLSKQCVGIMRAVSVIHNPSHLGEQRYGRHGDIKAENILWYPSHGTKERGVLVISDLGLAALNSAKSRSMQPGFKTPTTPSYRPPECDIKDGKVSRAFDVWTLGCLYLELLCWLLQGQEGKKRFDDERETAFIYGSKADIFFDVQTPEDPINQKVKYVFRVKDEVTKASFENRPMFRI